MLDFRPYALCSCMVAAMLSACSGSQPPIGAPGAMPQASAVITRANHAGSWMLPGEAGRDLLYISKPFYPGARDVYVYTYPHAKKLVGMLTGLGEPEGECVDKSGNVFIVDAYVDPYDSAVYEYAHGGTSPIATLSVPYAGATGCSIDPTSEKLAVSGGSKGTVIATFAYKPNRGWRFPKTYSVPNMTYGSFCGYDNEGNLYVDGTNQSQAFELAELPSGGSAFTSITLDQNINAPGQVQWDGRYLAVGDTGASPSIIYQFSISGSSGTKIGSTTLGGSKMVEQFWIQGKTVIGPDYSYSGTGVGLWPYPGGGGARRTITVNEAFGATVSLNPYRLASTREAASR